MKEQMIQLNTYISLSSWYCCLYFNYLNAAAYVIFLCLRYRDSFEKHNYNTGETNNP